LIVKEALVTIREVVQTLEKWFPLGLAESWDNVGLLLGDDSEPCERIMTCLTLTGATAKEAVDRKASLVVAHHPIFFRGIKRLLNRGADAAGFQLARGGCALFSPHTSFDGSDEGINQQWAERIGLENIEPLRPSTSSGVVKFVVFTPESDLSSVQQAVFAAGAGKIGDYGECSFRALGKGTFKGDVDTNPTVGKPGVREEVDEYRLEFVAPVSRIAEVTAAIRQAHSYEEPAFEIHDLHGVAGTVGAGRIGDLKNAVPLEALARKAGEAVNAVNVEFVGDSAKSCRRIATACGAGGSFLDDAKRLGSDALLVGEASFHDLLKAEALGVGLVLVGHFASERFAVETLAERIAKEFPALEVWPAATEKDPRRFVSIGKAPS
jgi:dinuclear metal center YbgI/SA1388 family protein